jgi:hypothetical protein
LFEEQEQQQQGQLQRTLRLLQEMAQKHDLELAYALQQEGVSQLVKQKREEMERGGRKEKANKRRVSSNEKRAARESLDPELGRKRR